MIFNVTAASTKREKVFQLKALRTLILGAECVCRGRIHCRYIFFYICPLVLLQVSNFKQSIIITFETIFALICVALYNTSIVKRNSMMPSWTRSNMLGTFIWLHLLTSLIDYSTSWKPTIRPSSQKALIEQKEWIQVSVAWHLFLLDSFI